MESCVVTYICTQKHKSVYYVMFHSQVLYGCLTWSLSTCKNINSFNVLQKKCLRIMNFSLYNTHTNNLFKIDKILKIDDIIKMEQLKLAYQFKKGILPHNIIELWRRVV